MFEEVETVIVGGGQAGLVYLSVGRCGRSVRRYRGKDIRRTSGGGDGRSVHLSRPSMPYLPQPPVIGAAGRSQGSAVAMTWITAVLPRMASYCSVTCGASRLVSCNSPTIWR